MVINRVAGLVLPYTIKPLLDKVLHLTIPADMLPRIIALVFSAMVVQAITSFSLTQLLSKAGQRLIAEMRPPGATARGSVVRRPTTTTIDRHARRPHHDRRRRRPQLRGHRLGGVRRRHADRGPRLLYLLHRSAP